MSDVLLKIALFLKDVAVPFVIKNFKPLLITAVVAVVSFFVFGYFILKQQLRDTKQELERTKAQVVQLRQDVHDITQTHIDLARRNDELRRRSEDLAEQLERRGKKSISELAQKKAKLVEKALNDGTAQALRCLEIMSEGGDC